MTEDELDRICVANARQRNDEMMRQARKFRKSRVAPKIVREPTMQSLARLFGKTGGMLHRAGKRISKACAEGYADGVKSNSGE